MDRPRTILSILAARGPLTGKELREATGADDLALWRLCRATPAIHESRVGRRYLRLDKQVDGYARLSPSIKRRVFDLRGLQRRERRRRGATPGPTP